MVEEEDVGGGVDWDYNATTTNHNHTIVYRSVFSEAFLVGVDTIVPTVMTSLLQAQCIDGCARANYH